MRIDEVIKKFLHFSFHDMLDYHKQIYQTFKALVLYRLWEIKDREFVALAGELNEAELYEYVDLWQEKQRITEIISEYLPSPKDVLEEKIDIATEYFDLITSECPNRSHQMNPMLKTMQEAGDGEVDYDDESSGSDSSGDESTDDELLEENDKFTQNQAHQGIPQHNTQSVIADIQNKKPIPALVQNNDQDVKLEESKDVKLQIHVPSAEQLWSPKKKLNPNANVFTPFNDQIKSSPKSDSGTFSPRTPKIQIQPQTPPRRVIPKKRRQYTKWQNEIVEFLRQIGTAYTT
eukprot:UN28706